MEEAKPPVFTVSDITQLIKNQLESSFPGITVQGEISNARPAASGHFYFSLKDEDSMLSCVMFKHRFGYVRFKPVDGMLVTAKGSISVYKKRGNYQLVCDSLVQSGEGTILAMLEERKRKLAAEGLFDEERKIAVPTVPSRIAVVTSPTGAAIRDILRVLKRRNAGVGLTLLPALVQGDGAAEQIAAQIRRANMFNLGEVLIIGRGGGSLEDLLPFSDEAVVRAVAESQIPVISAVGHEIDVSLSDLAADVRAATPSAAAEIVAADRMEMLRHVMTMEQTCRNTIKNRVENIRILLRQFTPEQMEKNFLYILQPFLLRLDDCKEDLLRGLKESVQTYKHRLEILKEKLTANSPQEILKKGYALVEDQETGTIIRDAHSAKRESTIRVSFADSSLKARVEEIMDERV